MYKISNDKQIFNTMSDLNTINNSVEYIQNVMTTQQQKINSLQQNMCTLQSQIEQQNHQFQLLQSKLDYLMNKNKSNNNFVDQVNSSI
jgi:peptidoglycan hydrolase CwlO-like protein